jgi:hypothetical protein
MGWEGATLEEREAWFKLMFNKVYVKNGAIKAIEPTPVMSALFDTQSGSDRVRSLLCTRFICFRRKNLGGGATLGRLNSLPNRYLYPSG